MLAFLLGAACLAGGAQVPGGPPAATGASTPDAAPAFHPQPLPGQGGVMLQALERAPRVAPLRYRVIVIPGSGCAGLGAWADRYFAGLLHAQVLVLHKPGVDPGDRTAPGRCPPSFVAGDALAAWQAHAQAAVQAWAGRSDESAALPTVLVGISEGAELLPGLAPQVPQLAGLVLLASSGLDPRVAGALQAQRLDAQAAWAALERAQAGSAPDGAVVQGRSLRYWRDLWHWPLARPLIDGPWPILQVWGGADELVPPQAYAQFHAQAQGRRAPFCARSLPGADHGLQSAERDGVQQVWAWLEQWARQPADGWCAPLQR
ncbi:MAG: alpha/beta hydrolase [Giesbergeria sp.]|jgi:hypothetical protein|nr:alpha/beta hydrolase [Giesbergeria sp.]